uniref:Uncharacterized protein n=1 Tax=Octopus bimaculoides TaxID=37653 RepID=A0A0L8FTN9_OCTBM
MFWLKFKYHRLSMHIFNVVTMYEKCEDLSVLLFYYDKFGVKLEPALVYMFYFKLAQDLEKAMVAKQERDHFREQ